MNILKYTLLLLLVISANLHASTDTIPGRDIRLGFDISGLARNYFEPGLMTWEIGASAEFKNNWYAAVEGGFTTIDIKRSSHNYHANGLFFRGGIDYNFINKSDLRRAGIVYGLARYGIGRIRHEAPGIFITNSYWGSIETSVPIEAAVAHWIETGAGISSRLFWNIHAGWSVRVKFLLHQSKTSGMEPYYFSGFGRNKGTQSVMIHYSIYYKF